MSDTSGYADQIQATASAVASRVRGRTGRALPWAVAYQSRSGPPNQAWLEPDLQHELAVSKKLGKTHVVVVPVGFVCDHVEVLFDLDVLAAQTARELGMSMMRAPTVGNHPTFIRLLAELATDRAESFYAKPER
jgi:protoporphyrin/coproporphyrin ferrochelatase